MSKKDQSKVKKKEKKKDKVSKGERFRSFITPRFAKSELNENKKVVYIYIKAPLNKECEPSLNSSRL